MGRWWTYQKERFPVFGHGPLIAAFSFCAVAYSAHLRQPGSWPAFNSALVAFLSAFIFFLQLRIADEFKDFEEDSRWRPYRPVPRGLVSLRELGWIFAGGCALQLSAALWLEPRQVIVLAITWTYLALMSREFFVRKWLKARPITYLWTHMLIMPLVDFYATSCDWMGTVGSPPSGLLFFLLASFCNGVVIELGRKIRAPEQEEEGVETYTFLYGSRRATWGWLSMLCATVLFACFAAWQAQALLWVASSLLLGLGGCFWVGLRFLKHNESRRASLIETASGLWTLLLYLSLGLLPGLAHLLRR
jgi:4-hydroxybenzoate polyprenyltransferase